MRPDTTRERSMGNSPQISRVAAVVENKLLPFQNAAQGKEANRTGLGRYERAYVGSGGGVIHEGPCGARICRYPGCVVVNHRYHALRGRRETLVTDETGPVSWQVMRHAVRIPLVHTQVAALNERGDRVTLLEFCHARF